MNPKKYDDRQSDEQSQYIWYIHEKIIISNLNRTHVVALNRSGRRERDTHIL